MAECSSICDCYTSEQTTRGIHLSDAEVNTPLGRVSIITRWGRGCVDFTVSDNEVVCYFQEGELKGFIEGNLCNLSWYDFFEFIQLLNGWVILCFIRKFWFQKWRSRWAQVSYRKHKISMDFVTSITLRVTSIDIGMAERQRDKEREREREKNTKSGGSSN